MPTIEIVAVANRPPAWVKQAEAAYCRGVVRFDLKLTMVRPAASPEKEAAAVLAQLPKKSVPVLLEASGKTVTSAEFAALVERWLASSRPPVFVIGGADGAAAALRAAADCRLSLSALTFPHALARLLLLEQLFRADCVMRGHPYPR